MRRLTLLVALAATTALAVVGVGAADTWAHVTPVAVSGNPKCSDLTNQGVPAGTQSIKFEPPVHGASSGGINILVEGNRVAWYTSPPVRVRAAIVKGGPNVNLYVYPAPSPELAYTDGWFDPVTNPKTGQVYGLGAVTFCVTTDPA
jgi:hypothetical protein